MNGQKPFWSSIISAIISIKLTGLLQILILIFGVIAGFEAWRRNRTERQLSEYKLMKLKKDKGA